MTKNRRQAIAIAAAAIGAGALARSKQARANPALAEAFAPGGRLRALINLGNPVLAAQPDPAAPPRGVSVDLATELARRIERPLDLVVVTSAGRAVETIRAGGADIGFFAIDPTRSDGVAFSAPYIEIEGAYLVRDGSPITRNDEVDRPGLRISVGLNSAYDLFLTREIRHATLVRVATSPVVVDEFIHQNLDVAAGVRQQLERDAARIGGLRILPGRFMVIEQAIGLVAGRPPAALSALRAFVEEMKATGFVAAALARHGIFGATVAPPQRVN